MAVLREKDKARRTDPSMDGWCVGGGGGWPLGWPVLSRQGVHDFYRFKGETRRLPFYANSTKFGLLPF